MTVKEKIQNSFAALPVVEGPIAVTEHSHPFCAMEYSRKPLDVKQYGYVEEEFFLSGKANVYDADEQDHVYIVKEGLPYKNRILVRRHLPERGFFGKGICGHSERYPRDMTLKIYGTVIICGAWSMDMATWGLPGNR